MSMPRDFDLHLSPFLVGFELTRQCELTCSHCAVGGCRRVDESEDLATAAVERLLGQVSDFPQAAIVEFDGGDPLYRHDIFRLVRQGARLGVRMAACLCPTPRLTPSALATLQRAGLGHAVMSVDGPDAITHDGMRGGSICGDFARTMRALGWAAKLRLPIQARTLVTMRNAHMLPAIADLLAHEGVASWQVVLLGPHRPGLREQRISRPRYAELFETIHGLEAAHEMAIEVVGANHVVPYGRMRGWGEAGRSDEGPIPARPVGVHEGKGVMFVDHAGVVYPGRDIPVRCGRAPGSWLLEVYQRHPTFRSLRDPDQLKGKCGVCEYRAVCGGNRARAMSVGGDLFSDEPDCDHMPSLTAEAPIAG